MLKKKKVKSPHPSATLFTHFNEARFPGNFREVRDVLRKPFKQLPTPPFKLPRLLLQESLAGVSVLTVSRILMLGGAVGVPPDQTRAAPGRSR